MKSRVARLISWLGTRIDSPLYLPLIALIAAGELLVSVLAMEFVLISSTLLRKERRHEFSFALAFGSGLGAYGVGWIVRIWGISIFESLVWRSSQVRLWAKVLYFIHHSGGFALFVLTVSPLPLTPIVVVCALARMPPYVLFLSVWLGRWLKYTIELWAAFRFPALFRGVFAKMPGRLLDRARHGDKVVR